MGGELGGPALDLEKSFQEVGFGDEVGGGCFFGICGGPIDFPRSTREDRPEYAAAVRYHVDSLWSVTAIGGVGAGGFTDGVRDGVGASTIGYSTLWGGVTTGYRIGPLWVGAGPGFERTEWTIGYQYPPVDPRATSRVDTRLAWMAEAAASVMQRGPFSLALTGRYRRPVTTARIVDLHNNTLYVRSPTVFLGLGLTLW